MSEKTIGLEEECPKCKGLGYVYTGGCTLEHGISTTCEEYGCPPRIREVRDVCKGKKVKTIEPA